MENLKQALARINRSAVAWSWVMNGLRLASGLVVLPLLVVKLSKPDYDIYFVFLSLTALVPILDLGFAVSIGRAVSYAMGGRRS
jgi:O-antigen/teichoic acid export membrane protein